MIVLPFSILISDIYFHLNIRKNFFYGKNDHSLEQPSQGFGRVPITGDFQDGIGQGARQSHLGSISHAKLDHKIFPNWAVL